MLKSGIDNKKQKQNEVSLLNCQAISIHHCIAEISHQINQNNQTWGMIKQIAWANKSAKIIKLGEQPNKLVIWGTWNAPPISIGTDPAAALKITENSNVATVLECNRE